MNGFEYKLRIGNGVAYMNQFNFINREESQKTVHGESEKPKSKLEFTRELPVREYQPEVPDIEDDHTEELIEEQELAFQNRVNGMRWKYAKYRRVLLLPIVQLVTSVILKLLRSGMGLSGTGFVVLLSILYLGMFAFAFLESRAFRHEIQDLGKNPKYAVIAFLLLMFVPTYALLIIKYSWCSWLCFLPVGIAEAVGKADTLVSFINATLYFMAIAVLTLLEYRISRLRYYRRHR